MVFSIIVPIYNAAPYIIRCLESIFDQNFGEKLFEVIVINDGSTDNSEEIARKLCKGRENVKILTQENKGLGGARNTGIDSAIGEYIIFLDADDYLEENSLSLISEKISDPKFESVEVFELGCNSVSEHGNHLSTFVPNSIGLIYTGIDYYLKVKSINSVCNKVYRRSSLGELRFKERIYAEDSDFNSSAYFFFKKVCALDFVLSNFVQTTGSITRSKNKETNKKYLQDTLSVLRSFQRFEKVHSKKTDKENDYFEKKYTLFTVTIFYLLFKYKIRTSEALKIKSDLKQNELYVLTYKGLDRNRDLFRKLLKYSFPLYVVILEFRNRLS